MRLADDRSSRVESLEALFLTLQLRPHYRVWTEYIASMGVGLFAMSTRQLIGSTLHLGI